MSSDFGQTIKHSLTYLSGKVALKSLSIIGIPIFTALLTKEDYGLLNIFTIYTSIGATVLTLNAQVGIGRYYYEDKADFKEYLGSTLVAILFVFSIFSILIISAVGKFSEILGLPEIVIYFILPFALKDIILSIHTQIFKAKRNSKKVRSLYLIAGYIGFAIGVALVYFHSKDNRYMGQLWAGLIMLVIVGIIVFYRIGKFIKLGLKKKHVKYILSYGVPLIPAYLSSHILSQFDRVMIGNYLGMSEAGGYSFAYNISLLLIMVFNALNYSWQPKYFEYMKAEQYDRHDNDTLKILSIGSLISCGLILFADWIGLILGSKSFHDALYLIPIIILGQYFLAINPIYKRHISFVKKNIYTSFIVFFAGGLNIWLNWIYIPKFGVAAGAYTTVLSYLVMFLLTYFVVKSVIKIYVTPLYKIALKAIVVVLACCYYYMSLNFFNVPTYFQVLGKFAMLALCAILLFKKTIWIQFSLRLLRRE